MRQLTLNIAVPQQYFSQQRVKLEMTSPTQVPYASDPVFYCRVWRIKFVPAMALVLWFQPQAARVLRRALPEKQ